VATEEREQPEETPPLSRSTRSASSRATPTAGSPTEGPEHPRESPLRGRSNRRGSSRVTPTAGLPAEEQAQSGEPPRRGRSTRPASSTATPAAGSPAEEQEQSGETPPRDYMRSPSTIRFNATEGVRLIRGRTATKIRKSDYAQERNEERALKDLVRYLHLEVFNHKNGELTFQDGEENFWDRLEQFLENYDNVVDGMSAAMQAQLSRGVMLAAVGQAYISLLGEKDLVTTTYLRFFRTGKYPMSAKSQLMPSIVVRGQKC